MHNLLHRVIIRGDATKSVIYLCVIIIQLNFWWDYWLHLKADAGGLLQLALLTNVHENHNRLITQP